MITQVPAESLLPLGLILFMTGFALNSGYGGLKPSSSLAATVASLVAALIHLSPAIKTRGRWQEDTQFLKIFSIMLFFVLCGAFAVRLWGKWIGDRATPEEKQPGTMGLQAWFSFANLGVACGIVAAAWYGLDSNPVLIALVIAALLGAQPICRMEHATEENTDSPENLAAEREKIFHMLEAGKLTAEESSELLQALGASSRNRKPRVPMTGGQRLLVMGGAIVIVGFFLPWFSFNPGNEANRLMASIAPHGLPVPNQVSRMPTVQISGGDVGKGMGWLILVMSAITAFLPYIPANLDRATIKTVRLAGIGMCAFFVLYLLSQNPRFVSIGLIMAALGTVLQGFGMYRDQQTIGTSVTKSSEEVSA